jgi:hypothetical protein
MKRNAAGRPPKPTMVDPAMLDAAKAALRSAARRLSSSTSQTRRPQTDPRLVDAVLAVRLAEALELLASHEITEARERNGLTWADVGAAFGTSAQSAHTRYRGR